MPYKDPEKRRTCGTAGGKSLRELRDEERAEAAAGPTVTSCLHCGWSHRGRCDVGHDAFVTHLAEAHPEILLRPKVKRMPSFRDLAYRAHEKRRQTAT